MVTSADRVEVAVRGNEAFVRVFGRGTFKIGPSLKQFGVMALDQGCSRIVVEMQECVGMDSTFMGVLAGLATTLRKINGEVVLRNIGEKNLFLVKMLGLGHLVQVEEPVPGESVMPDKGQILSSAKDKLQMTETMITAHEALIEAAPDNIVKFKDVLAYLKEDLKRTNTLTNGNSAPPK